MYIQAGSEEPYGRLPRMPTDGPSTIRRQAIRNGVKRVFPLSLMAGPFGIVYGATAVDNGIPDGPAILASFVILAGASQLALVDLIDEGAAWALAVGTALIINSRMALYSASLSPAFGEFPARWRFPLAQLFTDQAVVISLLEFETRTDPTYRRWFFVGAGVWFATPWWIGTVIGVLVGGEIPDGWQIGFAVPLMFLALLIPTLRSRPTVAAAITGAAVAVAASGLPNGVGIILGALAGIVVGTMVAEHTTPRGRPATEANP